MNCASINAAILVSNGGTVLMYKKNQANGEIIILTRLDLQSILLQYINKQTWKDFEDRNRVHKLVYEPLNSRFIRHNQPLLDDADIMLLEHIGVIKVLKWSFNENYNDAGISIELCQSFTSMDLVHCGDIRALSSFYVFGKGIITTKFMENYIGVCPNMNMDHIFESETPYKSELEKRELYLCTEIKNSKHCGTSRTSDALLELELGFVPLVYDCPNCFERSFNVCGIDVTIAEIVNQVFIYKPVSNYAIEAVVHLLKNMKKQSEYSIPVDGYMECIETIRFDMLRISVDNRMRCLKYDLAQEPYATDMSILSDYSIYFFLLSRNFYVPFIYDRLPLHKGQEYEVINTSTITKIKKMDFHVRSIRNLVYFGDKETLYVLVQWHIPQITSNDSLEDSFEHDSPWTWLPFRELSNLHEFFIYLKQFCPHIRNVANPKVVHSKQFMRLFDPILTQEEFYLYSDYWREIKGRKTLFNAEARELIERLSNTFLLMNNNNNIYSYWKNMDERYTKICNIPRGNDQDVEKDTMFEKDKLMYIGEIFMIVYFVKYTDCVCRIL